MDMREPTSPAGTQIHVPIATVLVHVCTKLNAKIPAMPSHYALYETSYHHATMPSHVIATQPSPFGSVMYRFASFSSLFVHATAFKQVKRFSHDANDHVHTKFNVYTSILP